MKNQYSLEEQLEKFKKAYLSPGTSQQFKSYLERGVTNPDEAKNFIPQEAQELYTADNNVQYHLNGRSILGVQRQWILERKDNGYQTKHGCSINTGLIQSDHSGFMWYGNMRETFIEAKDPRELLDIAKRLLNLSNEEMAREFNIMSAQGDIATLFNAIILDPIIDYEIERDNFGGYSWCWNDSNLIKLSTMDEENAYSIGLQSRTYENEASKPMLIALPNGESIVFRQNFKNEKGDCQYTIDDISTEIIEINGNSELIQRIVSQIERFSERKVEQEEDSIERESKNDKVQEIDGDSAYTSEGIDLLKRQILVKKLQVVMDSSKDGNSNVQPINVEEFELLTTMIYESVNKESIGHVSSDNTITIPDWDTPVPARQYTFIQLPDGKRICAEFLAHENSGTIKIKDFARMTEPENESDFIDVKKSIDEQELKDSFGEYSTDESLNQLLGRKLQWQEQELSSLEAERAGLDEQNGLEDQDIGDK